MNKVKTFKAISKARTEKGKCSTFSGIDYSNSQGNWKSGSIYSYRDLRDNTSCDFIRTNVANAQIMYSEAYTEYDEADIYDMLESVSLDEDLIGMECPLLDSVEFSSAMGWDE